jgi:hypothetical protein
MKDTAACSAFNVHMGSSCSDQSSISTKAFHAHACTIGALSVHLHTIYMNNHPRYFLSMLCCCCFSKRRALDMLLKRSISRARAHPSLHTCVHYDNVCCCSSLQATAVCNLHLSDSSARSLQQRSMQVEAAVHMSALHLHADAGTPRCGLILCCVLCSVSCR